MPGLTGSFQQMIVLKAVHWTSGLLPYGHSSLRSFAVSNRFSPRQTQHEAVTPMFRVMCTFFGHTRYLGCRPKIRVNFDVIWPEHLLPHARFASDVAFLWVFLIATVYSCDNKKMAYCDNLVRFCSVLSRGDLGGFDQILEQKNKTKWSWVLWQFIINESKWKPE